MMHLRVIMMRHGIAPPEASFDEESAFCDYMLVMLRAAARLTPFPEPIDDVARLYRTWRAGQLPSSEQWAKAGLKTANSDRASSGSFSRPEGSCAFATIAARVGELSTPPSVSDKAWKTADFQLRQLTYQVLEAEANGPHSMKEQRPELLRIIASHLEKEHAANFLLAHGLSHHEIARIIE